MQNCYYIVVNEQGFLQLQLGVWLREVIDRKSKKSLMNVVPLKRTVHNNYIGGLGQSRLKTWFSLYKTQTYLLSSASKANFKIIFSYFTENTHTSTTIKTKGKLQHLYLFSNKFLCKQKQSGLLKLLKNGERQPPTILEKSSDFTYFSKRMMKHQQKQGVWSFHPKVSGPFQRVRDIIIA